MQAIGEIKIGGLVAFITRKPEALKQYGFSLYNEASVHVVSKEGVFETERQARIDAAQTAYILSKKND